MLFSVEQAFVGRDETRAPLKTTAWEANPHLAGKLLRNFVNEMLKQHNQKVRKEQKKRLKKICEKYVRNVYNITY